MTSTEPVRQISRRADAAALWAAALFPSIATWLYFVFLPQWPAAMRPAYMAEKVVQFAFPLIWVLLIRKEKLHWARPSMAGMIPSLAMGVAVLSGTLLLYFFWLKPAGYLAAGSAMILARVEALGMNSPARFIIGGALLSSIHAMLEEYYWRWFLFGGLRRHVSMPVAVVLSSLAFMAHHVIVLSVFFGGLSLATTAFSLCVAVGGAAWATIYHRSGSLLGPWLSHAMIDAGIFIVGYNLIWGR